jgi:hypothetical protein
VLREAVTHLQFVTGLAFRQIIRSKATSYNAPLVVRGAKKVKSWKTKSSNKSVNLDKVDKSAQLALLRERFGALIFGRVKLVMMHLLKAV